MPKYIVADTELEHGADHIEAKDRQAAAAEYVERHELHEEAYGSYSTNARVAVILESDVRYYDVIEQPGYRLDPVL